MDFDRIAQSIQYGELARRVVAGMFEAPPSMVDDIYRWSKAQLASNIILRESNYRKNIQTALSQLSPEDIQKDWDFIIEHGNPENIDKDKFWKGQEQQRERYEGMAREAEEEIAQARKDIKLDPKVRIKATPWKRVKRKFKVNTRGWKYQKLLKDADPKRISYADTLFGVITVELVEGDLRGNAGAYWQSDTATLRVSVTLGRNLYQSIKHELRHWAQAYMRIALQAEGFGKPSRKIRTPDISQHTRGIKMKNLRQMGITEDDIHDLDDVEFYTELADSVDVFRKRVKDPIWEQYSPRENFNKMVGLKDEPNNPFFKTLKKHSRGKWQKAVKELAKAVL